MGSTTKTMTAIRTSVAPEADVVDFLAQRTERVALPTDEFVRGNAWIEDASSCSHWPDKVDQAKLIFTSPPYLQVIRYGKFNWIRLWLLGVDGWNLDESLFTSSSLPKYLTFMSAVMRSATSHLRSDGFACFVIGDVRKGEEQINLAEAVLQQCIPDELQVYGVIADRLPSHHKVSRIWKESPGRATKVDRVLVLGGRDSKLPPLERISWQGSSS